MNEKLIGGQELYPEEYRLVQERLREQSEKAAREADSLARNKDEISVFIVDDQDLVRNGFRLILSSFESLKVVGEAGDGAQALDLIRELHPQVVLMDIRMPIKNGIQATMEITQDPELDDVHVLILTTFDLDEYVYDALAAGASGFMLKDSDPDDIERAVRATAQGDALIQPSITRRLVETFVQMHPRLNKIKTGLDQLTDREIEILRLVARGMSNDEIAEKFVISPATVKTHVARIMSKLSAHDRAQLVVIAYEEGLVRPGL